ncbi:MAG: hypothetical protein IJ719_19115 [Clostridia bacterium]|nr:hypothetical protein [Clostridia bacterium]
MAKFIPKEKMSKKQRQELAKSRRTTWEFSPVSKVIDNKKVYNRKRISRHRDDDGSRGSFFS